MNLILGLNAFHPDSSACVLKDGKRAGWKAVFAKRTHLGIKLHPIESD
jgi:hypothetical protein